MNSIRGGKRHWFGGVLALVLGLAAITVPDTAPPEICDNGVDDDGDRLIDLNDTTDCACTLLEAQSLIPNPSFEEKSCCPGERGQLSCADTWIQASVPTTDYIHTCGFMGWEEFPPPRPFPDGEGIVGFRDGRVSEYGVPGEPEPNWKEYAGACLLSPLRANTGYRFEFYVGFVDNYRSPPIDVTFFGTTDCGNLPFGGGKRDFGCPANGPEWVRLGSTRANSAKGWVKVKIDVRPLVDITAIAIGPDCPGVNTDHSLYYFFDNLVLADERAFTFKITDFNHPCSPDYSLKVPDDPILDYQWYHEGIALVGETSAQLRRLRGEGQYQVRIQGATTCFISPAFKYRKPVITQSRSVAICQGEQFDFGNRVLNQSGRYTATFQSVNRCDSIVELELEVVGPTRDTLHARTFAGESYRIGNQSFRKAGRYTVFLQSRLGCDSLVQLELDHYRLYIPNVFSPNADGVNDRFQVYGDSDLAQVRQLRIFDRWGALVYEGSEASTEANAGWDGTCRGAAAAPGLYLYTAEVVMKDGAAHLFSGSVSLLR